MSYKKLENVSILSREINKDWNFSFPTFLTSSNENKIQFYLGRKFTSSLFDSANEPIYNGYYEREIYDSINHLYYQTFTSSLNTSSLKQSIYYESSSNDRRLTSYFDYSYNSTIKYFPTASGEIIRVISISKDLFGNRIVPNTFELNATNTYTISDDGYGNLYDSYNSDTHVGNIFYSQGLVVITNQDYIGLFELTSSLGFAPTPTPTMTPSLSYGASPSPTPTLTTTPTRTPTVSISPTKSITPTPSITLTISPSISATVTPSVTATVTRTPSITPTITKTPTISPTPTITPTITITPSITPTHTQTPTITPTVGWTPVLGTIVHYGIDNICNAFRNGLTSTLTYYIKISDGKLYKSIGGELLDNGYYLLRLDGIDRIYYVFGGIATLDVCPSPTPTPTITPTISITPSITPSITLTNSVSSATVTCIPICLPDCECDDTPSDCVTPTPIYYTNTPTPTITSTATPTVTPTITYTPSVTPSSGSLPTLTPTPTLTITPTNTITPSFTPSLSITPSITPTITLTKSITPSITPTKSVTPSVTRTVTPSPSITPSITISPSITPTISITPSITPTISITPSITPTISITPSITPTISITPSITPTISITPSITITKSVTPSITPTITPTITVTKSVTPSLSITPSITPTITITPSITPTITVTKSITPTITISPTLTPTISITPTLTLTPSITPTVSLSNSAAYTCVINFTLTADYNDSPDFTRIIVSGLTGGTSPYQYYITDGLNEYPEGGYSSSNIMFIPYDIGGDFTVYVRDSAGNICHKDIVIRERYWEGDEDSDSCEIFIGATPTPTVTPTLTLTPSITPTITITPSITPTIGLTKTPTKSITPSINASPTPTLTVTPTLTKTITPSITKTATPTLTLTPTITPTITITPSITPTISATPGVTPTLSNTRTLTPTVSLTPSITPSISSPIRGPVIEACGNTVTYSNQSSGTQTYTLRLNGGIGTTTVFYDSKGIPERFTIYDAYNNFLATSGWVGEYTGFPPELGLGAGSGYFTFQKNLIDTDYILVVDTFANNSSWEISITCPPLPSQTPTPTISLTSTPVTATPTSTYIPPTPSITPSRSYIPTLGPGVLACPSPLYYETSETSSGVHNYSFFMGSNPGIGKLILNGYDVPERFTIYDNEYDFTGGTPWLGDPNIDIYGLGVVNGAYDLPFFHYGTGKEYYTLLTETIIPDGYESSRWSATLICPNPPFYPCGTVDELVSGTATDDILSYALDMTQVTTQETIRISTYEIMDLTFEVINAQGTVVKSQTLNGGYVFADIVMDKVTYPDPYYNIQITIDSSPSYNYVTVGNLFGVTFPVGTKYVFKVDTICI